MPNPNRFEAIIAELIPYYEESMTAGDRTKILVPTELFDRYKQLLIDFWDEVSPMGAYSPSAKDVIEGGPVLFRGMECIPREAEDDTPSK